MSNMGNEDVMNDNRSDLQEELRRYRQLEQEVTDPLAMGLLREIVRELETEQGGGPASAANA